MLGKRHTKHNQKYPWLCLDYVFKIMKNGILSMQKKPYPKPTQVEYIKALERTMLKELDKMTS